MKKQKKPPSPYMMPRERKMMLSVPSKLPLVERGGRDETFLASVGSTLRGDPDLSCFVAKAEASREVGEMIWWE